VPVDQQRAPADGGAEPSRDGDVGVYDIHERLPIRRGMLERCSLTQCVVLQTSIGPAGR